MLRGAVGGAVSVGLHACAAAGLLWVLAPSEVPRQASPKAEMTLETATVTRRAAVAQDAQGADAASVAPEAGAAFSNPVPRREALATDVPGSRVGAVEPTGAVVSATEDAARPVSAAAPDGSALAEVSVVEGAVMSAAPEPVELAAAVPETQVVGSSEVIQQAVVPSAPENRLASGALVESAEVVAARPRVASAPIVEARFRPVSARPAPTFVTEQAALETVRPAVYRPTGQAVAASAPNGDTVPAGQLNSAVVAEGDVPDTVISAAMAFSGGEEMSLDPAALLAFTAFVAPDQAGQDGAELRDGIALVLSAVPCARLQTAFNAESGVLELRGHIPDEGMRATLAEALRAQIDNALPVAERLQILPEPQCGTLGQMSELGLPQSEEQFTDPALIGDNLFVREYVFQGGDRMLIDLEAADYPAYLYVDYFDAEGNVVHLMPNAALPPRAYAPGEVFQIGAAGSGIELVVEPPFGQDIAVAIASDQPLYEELRPLVEPADTYLAFLRERIAEVAPERAEWVYLMVQSVAP